MMSFLILETMMVGMFSASDFVVFYMFFEGVLIPMYFIIGVWGGPRRVYAAIKFFLFTLTGSVLLLLGADLHVAAGRHDGHRRRCCTQYLLRRGCRTGCSWQCSPPSR